MASSEFHFLIKHSTIYGIATVLSQAIGFIMLPVYTRYLTPKDYGVLNLIEISTTMAGIIFTTGIADTLSRFYYDYDEQNERNKIVSTLYISYCAICLAILPILYFSAPIFSALILGSKNYTEYFYVSFCSLVLGGLLDIGLTYLRIESKSIIFVIISTIRLIMLLSLNIYFIVIRRLGVLGILYSTLITMLFFQVVVTAPIIYKIKIKFSLEYAISMIRFTLPLIPARLTNMFIQQSDRYFIRYFDSIADTGIYSLSQKLGTAIHSFVTVSFQTTFGPRRFEIVRKSNAKEIFSRIFIYHILILTFVGLGISIFIPEILHLMVTQKFYRCEEFVPLIVFSMVIFGFRNHFEFGILWSKKTKFYAYINSIMSVINLLLNLILIFAYGIWGAVISSTLGIIIHTCLIYYAGQKLYFIKFEFLSVIKLFGSAIFIYFLSNFITNESIIINLIIKILLMILFAILIIESKIIKKEEMEIFKKLYYTKLKSKLPFSSLIVKLFK